MGENVPSNKLKKQAGIAIIISGKLDFKPKLMKRDGEDTSYSSREKFTKMTSQF